MSLSNLIRRKSDPVGFATATPATFATLEGERGRTVASVATVAVAKSPQGQTAPPPKVGAGATAPASRWWLVHYPDRDPLEVACYPDATHAEILERHPDAVAAEPFTPTIRQSSAPIMTADEEALVRSWLALIEETDPTTIAEVIDKCQRNTDARTYYIGRAVAELPKPDPLDNRITCGQCRNLATNGICRSRVVNLSGKYRPIRDLLQRCEGYAPGPDDPDRRPGRERWPWLIQERGE